MPIVSDSDALTPKINGDISSSLLHSSLEDEDSFVVLERFAANDRGPTDVSIQSLHTFQPFSNSSSFPTFNNLTTSGLASNSNNLLHSQFEVPVEQRIDSNNISVSIDDIQKQLQEVLRENVNLKENLFQTNLAMKQHMSTMRLLQDRASEVQKSHQAKFEETKSLILQMGSEKKELQEANSFLSGELNKAKQEIREVKESNLAFGNEMAKILAENDSLKKQLTSVQEHMRTLTENSKKPPLKPTAKELELHELADQLTRKLEGVERSRRQQEFDIERLKAQLGRTSQELNETQRKLAEKSLQAEKETPSDQVRSVSCSTSCQEKLAMYYEILNQLKTSAQEEQTRCDSLCSWLNLDPIQFEISELRRLLAEEQSQSVAKKKSLSQAISAVEDLLRDFKKIAEEVDLLKADRAAKESHSLVYDEIQKKSFTERLDALTAKLVEKEEALAISERHLASLQEVIRLQNVEKEELDEQVWAPFEPFFVIPTPRAINSSGGAQEQVQVLSKQLAVKEEQLDANNKEINVLKSEVERLIGIAEKVTIFEEQNSSGGAQAQVQVLTKQLAVKEEQLDANNKEINVLKSEVERLKGIAERVTIFEEQVKVYKDDFEAERRSRESLVGEKDRLLNDFKQLELRNQKLIEDLRKVKQGEPSYHSPTAPPANINTRQERSPSPTPPRPRQRQFPCPNSSCNQAFTNFEELQSHVIECWGLQD